MKMSQIISVFIALLLGSGTLLTAETPKEKSFPGTPGGCCVRATSDGKTCAHPCCVEAAKLSKNCEKCGGTNTADMKSFPGTPGGCCVRATSDGKTCAHPCCVEAAKLTKNCERCGGTNTAAAPAPKSDAPPAKKS